MDSLAHSIIETIRDPLLVLDDGLRIRVANCSFYRTFQTTPEEVVSRYIYELGDGQWDVPQLRTLLEEILPSDTHFEDFEI
jgi:two-component system CheB/CheR fusion protein